MALYGVLADVHGNREALETVLAALDRRGVRKLLCLGDVVGYNADPDECAALLHRRGALTIAGNHDLIGLGRLGFERCSNKAMYSLKRTRRALARDTAKWLAELPPHRVVDSSVVMVHGGVRDVQQYMTSPAHIGQNAELLRADFPGAKLCLFGHSHDQKVYEVAGNEVREITTTTTLMNRNLVYFINPGSVDASRKRTDKLAECMLLDTLDWSVEFLRLRYDCAATEAKAAVYGYRIGPWTDRLYSLRRRLAVKLAPKRREAPLN
ncbi:MAG TPA: metallophosphoesterase family protein [Burkholderiales bacterium]